MGRVGLGGRDGRGDLVTQPTNKNQTQPIGRKGAAQGETMTDQQNTTEDKPACGTVREIKEADTGQAVQPASQNAQGLRAMTERDVNDYMTTLLESQQPPPGMETLEVGALSQYKGINQQQGNVERRLTRAQAEVEQLRSQMSRMQGQSEAYVNLLVLAEDTRRADAKGKAN